MEKGDYSVSQANKAKLKVFGYGTALIALFMLGLVISNILMFNYMYNRFDQVGSLLLYISTVWYWYS